MRKSLCRSLLTIVVSTAAVAQTAYQGAVYQGAIKLIGTVTYPQAAPAAAIPESANDQHIAIPHPNLKAALAAKVGAISPLAVLANPDPTPKFVIGPESGFFGFGALTHVDSRLASNGNQFSIEPPDQGLAVGGGYVFEVVNDVVAIYNKQSVLQASPVALNAFFGLPPALVRTTPPVYGPSTGDPRVYYDQEIQRWFLTAYEEDINSSTGNPTGQTHIMLAVSQTSNPVGSYFVYAIDTTNDGSKGTPKDPGCPCFPDQPLNGADANGFYISVNEFPFTMGFNGAVLYATSKQALAAGVPGALVRFGGTASIPLAEGIAYSLQPARSLTFGTQSVEYFLSALDFFGTLDNRVALWALLNTNTLVNPAPNLKLIDTVLTSETYGTPVVGALQPPGPYPLGMSLGVPEEVLDPNDDRMNQVTFEGGLLWSGVNTIVGGATTPVRNGIAWFAVRPILIGNALSGFIQKQGYVAAPGQDSVIYPSIAVNLQGSAAMTFTLSGPTPSLTGSAYYPSMAYTRLSLLMGAGPIQLGGAGALPEDGFSGYAAYGGNGVARWGDYSAAQADLDGTLWMAAEWIPGTQRTSLANWGTFIGTLPR